MNTAETTPDHGITIARHLIDLGAFGHSFEEPTLWASKTYNPPYVDNRKLQSSVKARKALKKALASLVKKIDPKTIKYIYGVPKAGIAPATLLALTLGKEMLIKHDNVYYCVDIKKAVKLVREKMTDYKKSADIMAGTVPFGTIIGIIMAEELGKPFIFVRDKPKEHGLKQQVEGLWNPGDGVVLVDPLYNNDMTSYTKDAITALEESAGINIIDLWIGHINSVVTPLDTNDLKDEVVVALEDLVSTGESSAKEIVALKTKGASVIPFSIFDYGLESAVSNFAGYGLKNKSVLNFETLLGESSISLKEKNMLRDWHRTQPTWGKDHGFVYTEKVEEVK